MADLPPIPRKIPKPLRLRMEGVRESIIAISERVSRKVQILSLHWKSATIQKELDAVHQMVGARLSGLLDDRDSRYRVQDDIRAQAQGILSEGVAQARILKKELAAVEGLIGDLEQETLADDLLKIQHDLALRRSSLVRIPIEPGTMAADRSIDDLSLSANIRAVALMRGPVLLLNLDQVSLRPGDILMVMGPTVEVRLLADGLTERTRALV